MHLIREKPQSILGLALILAPLASVGAVSAEPARDHSATLASAPTVGEAAGEAASQAAAQGDGRTINVVVGRSQHLNVPWPSKGVSLTDPDVADVQILTPELLLVTGKSVGTTNVLVWNETGQTLEAKVEVNSDLSRLSSEIGQLFPGGGIQLSQTQSAVIVSGSLARAEQADALRRYLTALKVNYVDMTSVAGVQQVQVHVRMAEVTRTALRALGVNGIIAGSDAFGGSNIGQVNPTSVVPPIGAPADGSSGFNFGPTSISPAVTLFAGLTRGDLEIFVRALAENQYLRVLAEPSLVALSGSEASFLAGGEVPIPVVQGGTSGTAGSITIEFKSFGIGLRFRPTVLGDGGIRLEVESEASELAPDIQTPTLGGFTTPGFRTRRAETTLELKSGQTFAMAGLLNEKIIATSSSVPGLGSLPIIGALFRSVQYQKGETELLVLVTASLVEPISELNTPPLPGETQTDPTDWELYFGGHIEGEVEESDRGFDEALWMREMGLDRLKGPGAWMNYGQRPAVSTAKSSQLPPTEKPAEPATDK